MSPTRLSPRFIAAATIAVVGVVLAWRALDRSGGAPETAEAPVPEAPAHVQQRLETGAAGMVTPTEQTVTGLVSEAGADALAAIESAPDPAMPLGAARRRDFADAFEARLASVVAPDFDATLADLVARGWPPVGDERLQRARERWEQRTAGRRLAPFAPGQVEVRWIDPGYSIDFNGSTDLTRMDREPPPMLLEGYAVSTTKTIPGEGGAPRWDLAMPDQGIVEARVPMRLENLDGESHDVLVAFWFTWDREIERWRWLCTHVYSDSADGSFSKIPVR